MEVKELHQSNLTEYRNFILRALVEHSEFFRISVEDEISAPFPTQSTEDSFTLGAMDDFGNLMGIVSFQREGENRMKIRHKGLLFRMYVAQEFTGKGIGRALIQEVILRAKSLPNMEQINLTLVATNTRAKELYLSFGFKTYGIERRAHKSKDLYYDEEFMALKL